MTSFLLSSFSTSNFSMPDFSRSVRVAKLTIQHSADSVWHTVQLFPWWFYIPVGIVLLKIVVIPVFNSLFPFGRKD